MKRFMVWTIALVFLFCTSAIAADKKAEQRRTWITTSR